ncbi:MAG: ribonucleoside-diphosphate reductase, adenosylcobalamin-dependent [Alphaproteobacteria bacterium CG_4_10_14_0_2_um_filter_63_37]|nr:MAG: ribonucleoside-diphosphate reductase, adenosylcobalamin-dependent [Proteobacteria bacterium CG1_02_64_396]PJA25640.1 MAG: ribonucleoside-diphosphate reductase, adenosylcobalamin-dependent [Alphaproteobacteria bacterium CG_4_10_14_0_2_um_filter_63_37]
MTMTSPISTQIWDMKYRFKQADGTPVDGTVQDTWRRIASALASGESNPAQWEGEFYSALEDYKFLPAGRIISGSGTGRSVTLFNCYVMGTIGDSMTGIFQSVKEAALTMQQGGGIGYDFSTLRPKGALVKGVGSDASGPISFMHVWDSMCRTIMSAGSRRGAMMGTMRCDHPDIEEFITVKQDAAKLRNFNLSVLITDPFMEAVEANADWELVFPLTPKQLDDVQGVPDVKLVERIWSDGKTYPCKVYKTVRAVDLWNLIMDSTYRFAEPGVIFIDRINRMNNLWYAEHIAATNPCGEQPLPPFGACLLGSVNLTRFVKNPFSDEATIDEESLRHVVRVAVRMMDNVIDTSNFPLDEQKAEAQAKRRVGLGITGLADMLIMLGQTYGEPDAVATADEVMKTITVEAYRASIDLAKEKGAFPALDRKKHVESRFLANLPDEIRKGILRHGIRNSHLTSIAPTGTISLYADNVSSGLEPVFTFTYNRKILLPDGTHDVQEVSDYAFRLYRHLKGDEAAENLPEFFVDSMTLAPKAHLDMQAVLQKWIDSSISKTVNLPEDISFDDFKNVYLYAYHHDCKGCTTYRPNDVTGSVLSTSDKKKDEKKKEVAIAEKSKVVQLQPLLERPEHLEGSTYKIKTPLSDHALYVTLNDYIDEQGRRRPFEIFINSKNMEHFSWIVALTRVISAIFRKGGDVTFLVEELSSVFDPKGGYFQKGGRYMPSLVADIGDVIHKHLVSIGVMPDESKAREERMKQVVNGSTAPNNSSRFKQCPSCGDMGLYYEENCNKCISCGYSKCG